MIKMTKTDQKGQNDMNGKQIRYVEARWDVCALKTSICLICSWRFNDKTCLFLTFAETWALWGLL